MFRTFSRFFLCLPLWWIVSAQAGPKLPIWAAASWRNDIAIVRAHIAAGTNIDTVDDWTGKTALHYAAEYGHLDVLRWLKGNTQVQCTTTACDLAALNKHSDVVQWLISNHAAGCSAAAIDNAAF